MSVLIVKVELIDQLYNDCYALSSEISKNVGDYWDDALIKSYFKLIETVDLIYDEVKKYERTD